MLLATPVNLSIVIPAYNEAESLPRLVPKVKEALSPVPGAHEIIVVNDGSTDGTAEVLEGLRATCPELRVITFAANAGQTAGFDAGFKAARGDVVVTMDADLQNDPADMHTLLAHIGQFDVVCGTRVGRQDTFVRKVSSRIANAVRNWATGDDIVDTGCSLKAFRREKLVSLTLYAGMHRFLPTLMRMRGCTVHQVPVGHHPRQRGQSKYGIGNRLFKGLADLYAVRWMQKRFLRYRIKSDTASSAGESS